MQSKFLRCTSVFLFITSHWLLAQTNYSLTNWRMQQTSYTDISAAGTAIAMTNPESGVSSNPVDIGFTFNFNGTSFTQCMIHADGIMRFGTAAPGASTDIATSPANSYAAVFTSTAAAFTNVVLPLFTNLVQGSATPQFHVHTTGTAPNRVTTIQWKNLRDADNAGGGSQHQFANIEFQVKLYETTNDIEIIYGNWVPSAVGIAAQRRNASCGIKANNNSFYAIYRSQSNTLFHKAELLSQPNHTRLGSNGQPINKNFSPIAGFGMRFFGQITNDISLGRLYYDSIRPAHGTSPGVIEVLVRNEGTAAASDIEVKLTVTGANSHNAMVNIASLAAGAEQAVKFPEFANPNLGLQTITATVTQAADERNANNTVTGIQTVSRTNTEVYDVRKRSFLGVGYNNQAGLMAVKIYGTGTRKVSQIRIPFASYRNAVNVRIFEDGGTGGSPSATPIFTSASFFTTSEQEMIIPVIPAITVEGDYFIAVQQQTTTNMAWEVAINTPLRFNRMYNNTSGTWGIQVNTTPWQPLLRVYEESTTSDIGIERLTEPGCTYSNATPVKVSLRNFSNQTINFASTPATITGFVQAPNGSQTPFTINRNSGTLAAGSTEEVTILNSYDFSARGFHTFRARTNLPGDAEPGNDSLNFFINNSIVITSSASGPVCPLTQVTLTGVSYLANPQWVVDGQIFAGNSPRVINPVKNTVVKFRGVDYRGCTLEDSVVVQVANSGLPPKPILMFGDTILSHRNGFKDTVRVNKLAGHTIQWLGLFGTPTADSALILNQVVGMDGAKVSAAYVRTSDGCSNIAEDTLTYRYAVGILHNENVTLTTCDSSYYDAGGPIQNAGGNLTRSFIPATPGTKLKLTLYGLSLANFASFAVYDGPSAASPRIEFLSSTANGNTVREFIASNQSGALTVVFQIGSSNSQGWWAGLTCHSPEQYRTVKNGNWTDPSVWEKRPMGAGPFTPASRAPVKGDDAISIGHEILLNSSLQIDQVTVEPAGHWRIESPSVQFISVNMYQTVPGDNLLVKGKLSTNQPVQLLGSPTQILVEGHLANLGQIDIDSVRFVGNTTGSTLGVPGGTEGQMKMLSLENPNGVTMLGHQQISGIKFVAGMLNASATAMPTLTNGTGFVEGASNAAHVNGPCGVRLSSGSGERFFPIGKNGIYRPVEVNNSNANSEASDLIVAEMIPGAPPSRSLPSSVTDVSGVRYYKITRTGNSGIDFRVRLPYGIDDGVTNPADLTIVKDDGTPTWQDIGGTPSGPLPGTILSAATFNQFSDFALAAKTGSLPVSWLSFTATPQAGHVILQWRTATEVNCQTYFIERSANGQQFTTIAQVACLNQQNGASYQYTDATLSAGTWYYRLRQVDADGRFAYSATRQVHLMATPAVALYPNPARHFVLVSGLTQGQQITVYNAAGASVASLVASGPTLRYSAAALAAGWYQVVITSQDGTRQTLPLQISK